MRNNQYWKKRMEDLELQQIKKGEKYLAELDKQFRQASSEIEKELSVWYQRFSTNNNISMAESRKLLSNKDLKEFKWDVNEYIKYGKENAFNQKWMKELENASAKVHISRLESLKIQMQQQVEVLYGNQLDSVDKLLGNIYSEGYYKTAFEIQKGFGIGYNLHRLNERELSKILKRPWASDGKTFSDKIWTNKQELISNLNNQLTQSLVTGRGPDEVIKELAKLIGTQDKKPRGALYKAGRLVMTESAAFASAAQKDCFRELDVEKYEIVATLDNNTSDICQELDGEVFDMKDYQVGVTAPPFHPWCRTTTVPYFDDEFNLGERAARSEDGKTYYVPSDMKYKDWKEQFVDGGAKDSSIVSEDVTKFKKLYDNWDKKNVKHFATSVVNDQGLPLKVQRHKLKGASGQCSLNFRDPNMKVLSFELNSNDIRSQEYQIKTTFHELFHAKSHGLTHDIGQIPFKSWAKMDDVFAETTAHYMTKQVGITKQIAPSYASHLVEVLPKLKKLPEFKSCKTISDFGKVAYNYRFSNKSNASWKPLLDSINGISHDTINYSKSYIKYIDENKGELVDKLLENMPQYSAYKQQMIGEMTNAIDSINSGGHLNSNEKMVFENALIISMDRLGVK